MTEAKNETLQNVLAIVVSVGWLSVVITPIITKVEIDTQVQIGVQSAMMVILGAIFGIKIVRRGGNGGSEQP